MAVRRWVRSGANATARWWRYCWSENEFGDDVPVLPGNESVLGLRAEAVRTLPSTLRVLRRLVRGSMEANMRAMTHSTCRYAEGQCRSNLSSSIVETAMRQTIQTAFAR